MQHVERQQSPGSIERRRWQLSERNRGETAQSEASSKRRVGLGWLGLGAGVGALVAPEIVGAVAGVPLRGSTRALASTAGALVVAALVKTVADRSSESGSPRAVALRASVTLARAPSEVYAFWRELANLPAFMTHLESVTESGADSVWHAKGPLGANVHWEARILEDRPGERIAWRSLEGANIPNQGSVRFRPVPGGMGTEVHVELDFEPPAGALGAKVARWFAALPEQWLKNDLRRLKQILETGEVVRSDASIHRGRHPARPPRIEELPLIKGAVKS